MIMEQLAKIYNKRKRLYTMQYHVLIMSSEFFTCNKCKQEFSSQEELDLHVKQMSDAQDWVHNK